MIRIFTSELIKEGFYQTLKFINKIEDTQTSPFTSLMKDCKYRLATPSWNPETLRILGMKHVGFIVKPNSKIIFPSIKIAMMKVPENYENLSDTQKQLLNSVQKIPPMIISTGRQMGKRTLSNLLKEYPCEFIERKSIRLDQLAMRLKYPSKDDSFGFAKSDIKHFLKTIKKEIKEELIKYSYDNGLSSKHWGIGLGIVEHTIEKHAGKDLL